MKNWIKRNIKIITICLFAIMIVINILPTLSNNVYGEVNRYDNAEDAGIISDALNFVISLAVNLGAGVLTGPIAMLLNVFIILIFVLLFVAFKGMGMTGNEALSFPFPDQIIFNKIAFFDPNFINPHPDITNSPVTIMQEIISKMYYSFFILAGAVFIIAAMVIGIKLAISTIASEKAQYKEALTNWIIGIVLLFSVHFLMAGIFKLNEIIVEKASMTVENVEFPLEVSKIAGGALGIAATGGTGIGAGVGRVIGSFFGDAVNAVATFITGGELKSPDTIYVSGYGGMLLYYLANALSGDLVSSIVCGILLGQTLALVVTYVKRLFYCIILGLLAPLIVAVDVIKRSM